MRAWRLTLKPQSIRAQQAKLLALYMQLIHREIHSANQRKAFTVVFVSNHLCLVQLKHKIKSPKK